MKIILSTLKKILFWSYERGSLQYDVMCVLILAFIFLSPNRIFQSRVSAAPVIVRGVEIGPVDLNNLERTIQEYLERKGHAVRISRIEKAEDSSGETDYVVYQK
jgi:predicted ATP-grasp superfamily ATP-dependent carboligase